MRSLNSSKEGHQGQQLFQKILGMKVPRNQTFFLCSDNQSLVLISSLDELSKISRFICLPRFYFVFLPFFPWNLVYVISMEPLSINNFYSCIILCVTVRWLFSMEDLLVLVGFDVRTKITSVQNAALLFCSSNKCYVC